jgi:ATP-dependent Clp protease ATP-binding subunit ClpA
MKRSKLVEAALEFGMAESRSRGDDGQSATTADLLAGLVAHGEPQLKEILQKANLSTAQSVLKHPTNDPQSEPGGFKTFLDEVLERAEHAAEYLRLKEISTACILFAMTCVPKCLAYQILGNFANQVRGRLAQFRNVPELETA